MYKKIFFLVLSALLFSIFIIFVRVSFATEKVTIYFFWGNGCPHCAQEKPFLEELKLKYPQLEVKEFEVYYNKENQELFQKVTQAYNTQAEGVPMTFIGTDFIVGFGSKETTGKEIEQLIQNCLKNYCPSPEEILSFGNVDNWLKSKPNKEKSEICIHYFVKEQCSQCQNLIGYLQEISKKYQTDFKIYNISESKTDELIYQKLQEIYKINFSGFPIVFLGDSYLIGDQSIRENIEKVILRCQKEGCPCPVEEINQTLKQIPKPSTFTPEEKKEFLIPLFGKEIKISSQSSLLFLGVILGLADGINPCMFSVLIFLLTYLLAIGSTKRAVRVGLVFTAGVFIVYLFFMLGLVNLIILFGFIKKIKIIIAFVALIVSLILIKDFFVYGKWFSLEIPDEAKPFLESLIKKGTIPSAILLSLFSSLVELPCTAGIPLVYTALLAQKSGNYFFYLLWYNLFFVLPLLIIVAIVAFAWVRVERIEGFRLSFRKYMRLLAGLILFFLSIALLKNWI